MTEASRSTSTTALGIVMGFEPDQLTIKEMAIKVLMRINCSNNEKVLKTFNCRRISRRHGRCPQTERVLTSFLIKKFRASQPETTKLSVNLSYLAKENFGAGTGPRTQSEREPECTSGSVLQALGNYFTKC